MNPHQPPALGRADLEARVLAAVAAVRKVPVERITLDSTFEELGFDSLDGISLLGALEEELRISIPNSSAAGFRDVRNVADSLARLLAEPPGTSSTPVG